MCIPSCPLHVEAATTWARVRTTGAGAELIHGDRTFPVPRLHIRQPQGPANVCQLRAAGGGRRRYPRGHPLLLNHAGYDVVAVRDLASGLAVCRARQDIGMLVADMYLGCGK